MNNQVAVAQVVPLVENPPVQRQYLAAIIIFTERGARNQQIDSFPILARFLEKLDRVLIGQIHREVIALDDANPTAEDTIWLRLLMEEDVCEMLK